MLPKGIWDDDTKLNQSANIILPAAYANDAIGHSANKVMDDTMEQIQAADAMESDPVTGAVVDQPMQAQPTESTAQVKQKEESESKRKGERKKRTEPLAELTNLERRRQHAIEWVNKEDEMDTEIKEFVRGFINDNSYTWKTSPSACRAAWAARTVARPGAGGCRLWSICDEIPGFGVSF